MREAQRSYGAQKKMIIIKKGRFSSDPLLYHSQIFIE